MAPAAVARPPLEAWCHGVMVSDAVARFLRNRINAASMEISFRFLRNRSTGAKSRCLRPAGLLSPVTP
jgi:hypothetical protein